MFYIGIIIFSIIVHELGHLLTALYFKVNVKAFSIGFGPILLHKKWKEIDWRISLIPFGGYCDLEERLNVSNSLANLKYWQQMIIILAGVTVNLLTAVICYLIQYQNVFFGAIIDCYITKLILSNQIEVVRQLLIDLNLSRILTEISLLNFTLAVCNLVPYPALDGGYIWLLPLQRKLSEITYKTIIWIGFASLMILQIWLIYIWWLK